MLAPIWIRPAWRQFFLGGVDLRNYHRQLLLMDLFRMPDSYIKGLDRLRFLLTAEHISPPHTLLEPWRFSRGSDKHNVLVAFKGCEDNFERLVGHHELLLREYLGMLKPKWRRLGQAVPPLAIGINIRRAKDFADPKTDEDFRRRGGIRTPLAWFVNTLQEIRKVLGVTAPALVVSDGTASDLAPILKLENVFFMRPGCAASDLLALSRCCVLIGSGGSSFSAWASYLGQVPIVTIPGQSPAWFNLRCSNGAYVGEFNPAEPHPDFIDQLKDIARHTQQVHA
jgi:hypothetical protein